MNPDDKRNLLEIFENKFPNREYWVKHTAPEFTSLCPKTGQPDFATITLKYIPAKYCVELKSYKFYLQAYRNEGVFFEVLTNIILDDLVAVVKPKYMKISASFNTRGGISSIVEAEYASDDYLFEEYGDEFDDDFEDNDTDNDDGLKLIN